MQIRIIGTMEEVKYFTKIIQNQNRYDSQISEKLYPAKNNQIRKYINLAKKEKTEEK